MSASYNGLTVAFKEPVSQEYMERVKEAILLFVGVAEVEPVESNFESWILKAQVKRDLSEKLWDVLHGDQKREEHVNLKLKSNSRANNISSKANSISVIARLWGS